jgi:hypothetical protein
VISLVGRSASCGSTSSELPDRSNAGLAAIVARTSASRSRCVSSVRFGCSPAGYTTVAMSSDRTASLRSWARSSKICVPSALSSPTAAGTSSSPEASSSTPPSSCHTHTISGSRSTTRRTVSRCAAVSTTTAHAPESDRIHSTSAAVAVGSIGTVWAPADQHAKSNSVHS